MDHRAGLDDDFDGGFVLRTQAITNAVSPFEPPKRNAQYRAVPPGAIGPFDLGQWTDRTKAALRLAWDLEYSTAAIAERLGFTKNAIVGKAHRMHLAGRDSPIIRDGRPPSTHRATPRAAPRMTLPPLASVTAEIPTAISRSAIAAPRPSRAIRTPVVVGPAAQLLGRSGVRPEPVPIERVWIGSSKCTMPLWGHHEQPTHKHCEKPSPLGDSWCAGCRKIVFTRVRDQVAA